MSGHPGGTNKSILIHYEKDFSGIPPPHCNPRGGTRSRFRLPHRTIIRTSLPGTHPSRRKLESILPVHRSSARRHKRERPQRIPRHMVRFRTRRGSTHLQQHRALTMGIASICTGCTNSVGTLNGLWCRPLRRYVQYAHERPCETISHNPQLKTQNQHD